MALTHPGFERHVGGGEYLGYIEVTIDESDLTAAAVTEAISVSGFPANAYPLRAFLNVGEYFTGGTVSAMTAQVGDAADPDALVAALNVFGTTGLGDYSVGTEGVQAEYNTTGPALESAYAPEVLFTATGDNVVNCTAGRLSVRIYYKRVSPR